MGPRCCHRHPALLICPCHQLPMATPSSAPHGLRHLAAFFSSARVSAALSQLSSKGKSCTLQMSPYGVRGCQRRAKVVHRAAVAANSSKRSVSSAS